MLKFDVLEMILSHTYLPPILNLGRFLFKNNIFAFFVIELWLLKLGSRSLDNTVVLPSCSKTSTLLAIYLIIPQ